MAGPLVDTRAGRVEGTSHDGYERFYGIPYAAPPVGARRFVPPQPPVPFEGVRRCDVPPPHAPQVESPLEGFMGEGAAMVTSEADCLALNVWTPRADGGARPVMVFVHGGGFVFGSSTSPMYDGSRLAAAHDVVVVSCNYRLAALGFSSCEDALGERFAGSGCAGVLDAVAALQWVADNVAGFGGDPSNVTVFGESAGAMSIGTLLGLDAARGLVHKAILQSGAASHVAGRAAGATLFAELCEVLGVAPDAGVLQSLPTDRVIEAQATLMRRHEDAGLTWEPVVDGTVLARPPLVAVADGSAAGIPLLVGTNLDEWRLFSTFDPGFASLDDDAVTTRIATLFPGDPGVAAATYRKRLGDAPATRVLEAVATDALFRVPAHRLLEAQLAAGGPAWSYLFTWPSSAFEGLLGCCHALELPFVFDTLDTTSGRLLAGDDAPRGLARDVQATWAAFARYGDPARGPLGAWPRYRLDRRATMVLDVDARVEDDPLAEERLLWEPVGQPGR
jgi:para-nitrobenzyl esterase